MIGVFIAKLLFLGLIVLSGHSGQVFAQTNTTCDVASVQAERDAVCLLYVISTPWLDCSVLLARAAID
jgi:hypothetical protein